ncbi:alanine racemase [Clostridia bacterium]|nr:alanine racemase [Clostridia bacterium]
MLNICDTPSVQIDLDVVERNIASAVSALSAAGITHRPHIKVHKSVELAKMQIAAGCRGITCAKLGEAEVFAAAGIDDILLAYPLIGDLKLERYAALMKKNPGLTIRTVINSFFGALELSELGHRTGKRLPVLIELDGGIARGGVRPENLPDFCREISSLAGIEVVGTLAYGGDIYGCRTESEIRARARTERDEILSCGEILRRNGYRADILSGGSSFSLRYPEELKGLTEVRAGNYIFNDNALCGIGIVSEKDCAMRIVSTVVARPDKFSAIIDAGSKTLTTDTTGSRAGYGFVTEFPGAVIVKLNEEHGYVNSDTELTCKIGDVVHVIPNHACTVPNLCEEIYGIRNGGFDHMVKIDARGKNR